MQWKKSALETIIVRDVRQEAREDRFAAKEIRRAKPSIVSVSPYIHSEQTGQAQPLQHRKLIVIRRLRRSYVTSYAKLVNDLECLTLTRLGYLVKVAENTLHITLLTPSSKH